ncbi:hypothetical protein [Streptomyces sp. G-G2]|uniref:hypothetical protein n=1 Tax=Streptomyces sp. G-G2 TaxID=3046201 RepID=UPI0024B9F06C|nr:hypothetical protein [Streptomyces sp. G-G2]MDJ0380495.1 hypothetical protein [Streptomyces sp. G-G2]
MHRTKASRVLVPSALTAAILLGAAAPASALDGEKAAALTERVATVQQQIDARVAAAGPIDDLLASLTKTIADLLKTLQGLIPDIKLPEVPGVKLPDIKLPEVKIPDIKPPKLPNVPAIPAVPGVPAVPAVPTVPGAPAVTPAVPDIPDIPDIPGLG